MYLKNILVIGILIITVCTSALFAGSMIISDDITIEKGDYATLLTSGTCTDGATTPTYTWTIDEHVDEGVFSTEDIFYFLPSSDWTDKGYHINAIMHCQGEDDITKEVIVTVFDENCTHFTSEGICVRFQVDIPKASLYLKHGENSIFALEQVIKRTRHQDKIVNVKFLPFSDASYSMIWTPYNCLSDDSVYLKRLSGDGTVITENRRFLASLKHMGGNPDVTILKNDNFIIHWCHHWTRSEFQLYDKDGNSINGFEHESIGTVHACRDRIATPAQIVPLDDGGFQFSFGDYNNTFDSDGNPMF